MLKEKRGAVLIKGCPALTKSFAYDKRPIRYLTQFEIKRLALNVNICWAELILKITKKKNKMTSYLGLDIGIATLGFALIEYDDKSKNGKIVTSGVRTFQEALTGKGEETKKPRNVTRRENRLMRRQIL